MGGRCVETSWIEREEGTTVIRSRCGRIKPGYRPWLVLGMKLKGAVCEWMPMRKERAVRKHYNGRSGYCETNWGCTLRWGARKATPGQDTCMSTGRAPSLRPGASDERAATSSVRTTTGETCRLRWVHHARCSCPDRGVDRRGHHAEEPLFGGGRLGRDESRVSSADQAHQG